jgi:anaphase-promoting complex subunit 6
VQALIWESVVLQECYALTSELLEKDPYALEAMPVHLAAALELGKKNELFLKAHR